MALNTKSVKYRGAGIYAIVNADEMKIYVGQAKNIQRRACDHKHDLKTGEHANPKLNLDREKDLRFIILQKVPKEYEWLLNLMEKTYMLQVLENGFELYNVQNCESKDNIENSITFESKWAFKAKDNLDKSFYNEYLYHTWYFKNKRKRRDAE